MSDYTSDYTPLFISSDWSYGPFFDQVLKNPSLALPDWRQVREHIGTAFFRLHSMFIPELTKAAKTFLPFRPALPTPNRGECPLLHERRTHFLTVGYFHAVADAVETNMPAYEERPAVRCSVGNTVALLLKHTRSNAKDSVVEYCKLTALQIVSRELPRLRALLRAIQIIVWPEPTKPFHSHFTAPSEEFTDVALYNIEDTLEFLDLEQLAVSVNLLGGWELARGAVEAHFRLKFPSLTLPGGQENSSEQTQKQLEEKPTEKQAVDTLASTDLKVEQDEESSASSKSDFSAHAKQRKNKNAWTRYRKRTNSGRKLEKKALSEDIESNGIVAASLNEFARLAISTSNSDNSSRSSSRSGASTANFSPAESRNLWSSEIYNERNEFDSVFASDWVDYGAYTKEVRSLGSSITGLSSGSSALSSGSLSPLFLSLNTPSFTLGTGPGVEGFPSIDRTR